MSKTTLNLLLLVIAGTLYYMVLSPLYTGASSVLYTPDQSISYLRDLNNGFEESLKRAEDLIVKSDDLKSKYKNFSEEDKIKMLTMIPRDIDPVRLIDEVEYITKKNGFALDNVSYAKSEMVSKNNLKSYVVSISVKGNYFKFKELIEDFEHSLRLYSLKSVVFSVPSKEGEPMSYQIKLETYYMK